MSAPDPWSAEAQATFKLDQEAAQTQEQTREETQWALNIRQGEAQAAGSEAVARTLAAKAKAWEVYANVTAVTAGVAMWTIPAWAVRRMWKARRPSNTLEARP